MWKQNTGKERIRIAVKFGAGGRKRAGGISKMGAVYSNQKSQPSLLELLFIRNAINNDNNLYTSLVIALFFWYRERRWGPGDSP